MEQRRPIIHYPCPWDYQLIGRDEGRMREATISVVGDAQYVLTRGNSSAKSRYCSLHLTLEVRDEAHRLHVFETLRRHEDVLYVL